MSIFPWKKSKKAKQTPKKPPQKSATQPLKKPVEQTAEKTQPKAMMATVPVLNNFYRDQYQKLFIALILTMIFGVITLCFGLFLLLNHPQPIYFSAAFHNDKNLPPAISKFSIVPLTPINQANMSDINLSQWVVNAMVKSFSLGSQEYRQEMQENRTYFNQNAWQNYLDIMKNLIQFDTLTTRQALVSVLTPLGAPIIDNQGVSNNQYLWVLKLPVIVKFYGSKSMPDQKMDLSIIVGRISMEKDVYGIKIISIKASNIKQIRGYSGPASNYAP